MKREKDKIHSIILEIVSVLLDIGGKDIFIHTEEDEKETKMKITLCHKDVEKEMLDRLNKFLNFENSGEVEGQYWKMLGKDDGRDNLYIVGSLLDRARVRYLEDDNLEITMYRKR